MANEQYRFDEFVIESVIGEGGMGKVYRAWQTALGRWVALKVLPRSAASQAYIERFYREARAAARLVHPNIIQIHTVGEHKGVPYFTMEYIEGADLEHLLALSPAPLSNDEITEIVTCVVKALKLAHEHGIVHRDIKPANIMVSKTGLVKVMDFGLAKELESSMTRSGVVVGTPTYLSPEQGAGSAVDFRSDLYSLGCVTYEMIAGKPPFVSESIASLVYKHTYEEAVPLEECKRVEIQPGLMHVARQMMAKKPADRPQELDEVLEALASIPVNTRLAELSLAKRVEIILRDKSGSLPLRPLSGESGAEGNGNFANDLPRLKALTPRPPDNKPVLAPISVASAQPKNPHRRSSATMPALGAAPSSPARKSSGTMAALPVSAPAAAYSPPAPDAETVTLSKSATGMAGISSSRRPSAMEALRAGITTRDRGGQLAHGLQGAREGLKLERDSTVLPTVAPLDTASKPALTALRKSANLGSGLRRDEKDKNDDYFQQLNDGRWSYDVTLGRCRDSDGLARIFPLMPDAKVEKGLGDCLICSNWSRKNGCSIAACRNVPPQYVGLSLAVEQSLIWVNAGRLDRAAEILDSYVRANPDDAAGYRELARIYDRPDYRGPGILQVSALYERFAELATQKGTHNRIEVMRAQERVKALALANKGSGEGMAAAPGHCVQFDCFYRRSGVNYCVGMMDRERLVLARAGDMDPESGTQAGELTGTFAVATSFLRRFQSDSAKSGRLASVTKELSRLIALGTPGALEKDPACAAVIGMGAITSVESGTELQTRLRVTIKTGTQSCDLIFRDSQRYQMEQVMEVCRRVIAIRQRATQTVASQASKGT